MRKFFSYVILPLALLVVSSGLDAQDCGGYYPVKEGTMLGYKTINDKGKLTGSNRQTILNKTLTATGVDYTVRSEAWDDKDKLLSDRTLTMRCEGGKFFIDMKSLMDPAAMGDMKDMQMEVNGVDMEIPSTMAVGQTLPDANVNISFAMNGMVIMRMYVKITNRKVVAQESITIPAGTFDCLKITYDLETKAMAKITASAVQWMAKGPGLVKSETYDKKGKLTSSQILNEFKN
jgi:hypothetical protein